MQQRASNGEEHLVRIPAGRVAVDGVCGFLKQPVSPSDSIRPSEAASGDLAAGQET
jgi:hypothetical protein